MRPPVQPPTPQAGTSSASGDSFPVDLGLLVKGKDEAARFAKLLKVNKLKLVSADWIGIDPTVLSRNEEKCNKLESEKEQLRASFAACKNNLQKVNSKMMEKEERVNILQEENNKFEDLLAVRRQRLEEADRKVTSMGVIIDVFQDMILYLLNEEDKNKQKIENLRKEILEADTKLQTEKTKRNAKHEKTVKILRSQLKQAKNRISESNGLKEKLSLENAKLSTKLKKETENLKVSFQNERSRRLNKIIALKEEKKRMTKSQFTFMGFIRQLKERSCFSIQNESNVDLLNANYLECLLDHVNTALQNRNEETSELIRSRELIQKLEVLFQRARESDSEIPTSETGTTQETANNNVQSENMTSISSKECNVLCTPLKSESFVNDVMTTLSPQSTPSFGDGTPVITSVISLANVTEHSSPTTREASNLSSERVPGKDITNTIPIKPEVDPYDIEVEFGPNPSIVPPVSLRKKQIKKENKNGHSPRSRPLRNEKQYTPHVVTSKPHGVNKRSAKFRCLCSNVYTNAKGLSLHIRKMTTEWKHKCTTCLQYFFHQSELKRHVSTSSCQVRGEDAAAENPPPPSSSDTRTIMGENIPANSLVEDLPSPQLEQRQQDSSREQDSRPNLQINLKKRKMNKRIKRKRCGHWLSKTASVQGTQFWYCKCGSKFSSKRHLQTHTYYFTLERKFKCPQEQCQQKFYSLKCLKSHLTKKHEIVNPLKKYSTGCNFCGKMFVHKKNLYKHRKNVHNLQKTPNDHCKNVAMIKHRSAALQRASFQVRVSIPAAVTSTSSQSSKPVIVLHTSNYPLKDVECIDLTIDDQDDHDEATTIGDRSTTENLSAPSSSPPPSGSSTFEPQRRARHGVVWFKRDLDSFHDNRNAHLHRCECGKEYKTKNGLLRHIKIEKYGSMYACKECSGRFTELSTLKGHIAKIHLKPYDGFSCGLCKMPFISTNEFSKHRLIEHQHV